MSRILFLYLIRVNHEVFVHKILRVLWILSVWQNHEKRSTYLDTMIFSRIQVWSNPIPRRVPLVAMGAKEAFEKYFRIIDFIHKNNSVLFAFKWNKWINVYAYILPHETVVAANSFISFPQTILKRLPTISLL
jgi:hypothetical protein